MPSDFANAGKALEAGFTVPDLPIESIRSGARAARMRQHWRTVVACTLAIVVALGSGTVLAAKMLGIRIWLSGDRGAMTPLRSFTIYLAPDETTLRHVVSTATFPVVLPVGLPSDARVLRLVVTPTNHPSVIAIMYHARRSWDAGFTLADSSIVQQGAVPQLPNGQPAPTRALHHWSIGGETIISGDLHPWVDEAGIKAAMLRATPEGSLAQNISRLYRITYLGGFWDVANVADAVAPRDGRSTLVDRANLGQVRTLIRDHKPLFSMLSTMVDNIPTVHGNADIGHASYHSGPRKLAVSAGGLRAIAAVLATKVCGSGAKFTCEMLINERSGMPYRIWVLPIRSPQSAEKYVVNRHTFQAQRMR